MPGRIGTPKRNGPHAGCFSPSSRSTSITVGLNVRLNNWNNDFYDALQQYDWPEFWRQFAIFGILAFSLIVVAVYSLYLRQILHIRWRRWLTDRFLSKWLEDQSYYRMQLNQATTDNPDQRISEDLDRFATITLALSLGLLSSFVTLVSFITILWTLSGALTIPLGGGAAIDDSRLHGVCRTDLCGRRHVADPLDRAIR